ncbi:MAG: NADH-quinone oxidoreductase subunit A [bacterium]
MLTSFLPIILAAMVAFALAIVMTIIAQFLGPKRRSARKEDPYECGIIPDKPVVERFDVRYYVIAILFIAFDVEVVFLYPWAVAFDKLGLFGFIEMVVFVVILLVAYLFAIKNGVFDWGTTKSGKIVRKDNPWNEFRRGK